MFDYAKHDTISIAIYETSILLGRCFGGEILFTHFAPWGSPGSCRACPFTWLPLCVSIFKTDSPSSLLSSSCLCKHDAPFHPFSPCEPQSVLLTESHFLCRALKTSTTFSISSPIPSLMLGLRLVKSRRSFVHDHGSCVYLNLWTRTTSMTKTYLGGTAAKTCWINDFYQFLIHRRSWCHSTGSRYLTKPRSTTLSLCIADINLPNSQELTTSSRITLRVFRILLLLVFRALMRKTPWIQDVELWRIAWSSIVNPVGIQLLLDICPLCHVIIRWQRRWREFSNKAQVMNSGHPQRLFYNLNFLRGLRSDEARVFILWYALIVFRIMCDSSARRGWGSSSLQIFVFCIVNCLLLHEWHRVILWYTISVNLRWDVYQELTQTLSISRRQIYFFLPWR